MLFFIVVVLGGGAFLKNNLTITPDNQVHIAGWAVPIPASVQSNPITAMVIMMVRMQSGPQLAPADPRYATAAQPGRPAVPTVTSANGSYNANAPSVGAGNPSDQLNAVARALRTQ
jgi:hypothetical protein